jgi:hypothetical protein
MRMTRRSLEGETSAFSDLGLIGDDVTCQAPDLVPYPGVIDAHDAEAVDHFPYPIG